MSAPTATMRTRLSPPESPDPSPGIAQHEDERQRAYEYWGYLFKPDKTGTDRLKALLAGLKNEINKIYEPSDCPDLTPIQLAGFYRDLHGNYDQLFLGTPSESIAFIYKSLGCLHSLQPQGYGQSTAFSDPTVPALKTEGWAMWQTIQLLLGPDEHAGFLSEAVQKWDITDPTTGDPFPRLLPRECFPMEPDKHMVAWYEGVSERLRKEAEDEERQRDIEAEQAEVRRIRDTAHGSRPDVDDEVASQGSRGPALAYFKNPLYRHVDGRPSIVRRNSRRHASSPRPATFVDKGKGAATTFSHVVRNIGSPHLWDGRGTHHGSESRERRRRSVPEHHLDGAPTSSHGGSPVTSPYDQQQHHRRNMSAHGSHGSRSDRLAPGPDDLEGISPGISPRPPFSRHTRRDSREPILRRPRSHDPTPTGQREPDDYFQGAEIPPRRNSTHGGTTSPPTSDHPPPNQPNHLAPPVPGPNTSFNPSASPLFATHIARQPQPVQPPSFQPASRVSSNESHRKPNNPHMRRTLDHERGHHESRSPAPRDHDDPRRRYESPDPRRRFDSPRRPRPEHSPHAYDYDEGPPPSSRESDRFDPRRHRRSGSDAAYSGPEDRDRERYASPRDRDRDRQPAPRAARFAPTPVQGVDGRRYPDPGPWR